MIAVTSFILQDRRECDGTDREAANMKVGLDMPVEQVLRVLASKTRHESGVRISLLRIFAPTEMLPDKLQPKE